MSNEDTNTTVNFLILSELIKMNDIASAQYKTNNDYGSIAYKRVQETLNVIEKLKTSSTPRG